MRAVILAELPTSGLEPFSFTTPPALLPVAGKPILGRVKNALSHAGFSDVVTVASPRTQLNAPNVYLAAPLTGAASVLREIHQRSGFEETFAVLRADFVGDLDLRAAVETHRRSSAIATMLVDGSRRTSRYGSVEQDITGAIEQIRLDYPLQSAVAGIYLFEPDVIARIPSGAEANIECDLLARDLVPRGRVASHACDGHWLPITNVGEYLAACLAELDQESQVGQGTDISPTAEITAPCWIGANCAIDDDVTLSSCVVEDDTRIGAGFSASNCIIRGNQIIDTDGFVTIADRNELSWIAPVARSEEESEVTSDLLRLASRVARNGGPAVEHRAPEYEHIAGPR